MNIVTDTDCSGVVENHPWSQQFTVIGYSQGGFSTIPHNFFRDWLEKWLGLFEQLFPKNKWSHCGVKVLGNARQS